MAPEDTKVFAALGPKAEIYEYYNMTLNHHSWGISPDKFDTDEGLSAIFYPTSISIDDSGLPFVASMESKDYPFFGT